MSLEMWNGFFVWSNIKIHLFFHSLIFPSRQLFWSHASCNSWILISIQTIALTMQLKGIQPYIQINKGNSNSTVCPAFKEITFGNSWGYTRVVRWYNFTSKTSFNSIEEKKRQNKIDMGNLKITKRTFIRDDLSPSSFVIPSQFINLNDWSCLLTIHGRIVLIWDLESEFVLIYNPIFWSGI